MENQRVNCIGISLGASEFCVSVLVGNCPVYLHGTHEQIRQFGRDIIAEADRHEGHPAEAVVAQLTEKEVVAI